HRCEKSAEQYYIPYFRISNSVEVLSKPHNHHRHHQPAHPDCCREEYISDITSIDDTKAVEMLLSYPKFTFFFYQFISLRFFHKDPED
ncbi:MAG: hypothetical protein MUO82_06065, partial [Candidatus Thermoplasmatota archaeon]|nr:hypothetical protein [Candidatus Thermoplasmatota archaeon]